MRGRPHYIGPAQPSAGTVATIEVPGPSEFVPRSIVFTYTCSAGAANRKVWVEYRASGGLVICVNEAALVLIANDALRFGFSSRRGVAEWNTNTDVLVPLEPLRLTDECSIVIGATNIQAADQISAIGAAVELFDSLGE